MGLFVSAINILGLISKNMDFYDTCRAYMHLAEQKSGLASVDVNDLRNDLLGKGFNHVEVEVPTSAMYGSSFYFTVKATYTNSELDNNLLPVNKSYMMNFKQKIIARRIYSYEP